MSCDRFSFKESTCFFFYYFTIDDTLILDSYEFLLDGSLHVMVQMQILDETRCIDPTCYHRKISWRIQNFGFFKELI